MAYVLEHWYLTIKPVKRTSDLFRALVHDNQAIRKDVRFEILFNHFIAKVCIYGALFVPGWTCVTAA